MTRSTATLAFAVAAIVVSCGSPPSASPPAPSSALAVTITRSVYGLLEATTASGASCTASSVLPSGNPGLSRGLRAVQVADGAGHVAWIYDRGSNTRPGTGTHTVRCSLNGQNVIATAPFSVP